MLQYRTQQGDILDAICFKHYSRENATLAVLDANAHLSDMGSVYQAGVLIDLPVLPDTAKAAATVRLWD